MKRILLLTLLLVSSFGFGQGSIIWQKSLGGSDLDYINSFEQIASGGYIVAGWSLSNNGDVKSNAKTLGYTDHTRTPITRISSKLSSSPFQS